MLEEQHDPAAYAHGLLSIVHQIDSLHARHAALELSRRAAQTMLGSGDSAAIGFSHRPDRHPAISDLTRR